MYTQEQIDDLKQKSSRWREVIPKIISDLQDQQLRNSFNVLLEDWKNFDRESTLGLFDYSQKSVKLNNLTYSYVGLCNLLPIKTNVMVKRKDLFKLMDELLIKNQVEEAIDTMRNVLEIIKTGDSIDFQSDLLLLQSRAGRFFTQHQKGFNPSDSELNKIKDSALSYFNAIKMDDKLTNQIKLFTDRGLYDEFLCVNEITVNNNTNTTNNITINNHNIKVELSQVEISSGEILDEIFVIFKSYFNFVQKNFILFPNITKEAKEVANDLIGISFTLVESSNLSEVDKIKKSLSEYRDELKALKKKADEEMNDSENNEGTQILALLKDETPTWTNLKKAYKLLKQSSKKVTFELPEDEPLSPLSKRKLKQQFFEAIK